MQAETGARKVAERKVKQLELDVSSALSSKACIERNCRQAVQVGVKVDAVRIAELIIKLSTKTSRILCSRESEQNKWHMSMHVNLILTSE